MKIILKLQATKKFRKIQHKLLSNEDDQDTEVANNEEVSEDTTQTTSNEDDQDTEVANNEEVSEDTTQTTSNEDDQNSNVAF
ncbi:hypothetical protein [Mammaliicoccus sciuri]|uniref:hypothetical protein n=1 Tax=Mammaliicoccus sciuri TaxID=1296 RepID=UPI0034DCE0BF